MFYEIHNNNIINTYHELNTYEIIIEYLSDFISIKGNSIFRRDDSLCIRIIMVSFHLWQIDSYIVVTEIQL